MDLHANVCSVQLSRQREHLLAVGCADHRVHLYDLRNLAEPLRMFSGGPPWSMRACTSRQLQVPRAVARQGAVHGRPVCTQSCMA